MTPNCSLQELVQVVPKRVPDSEYGDARWSVYLVRVQLFDGSVALKVGMVGTGTLRRRLVQHHRQFGDTEVLAVWSLADAAARLDADPAWRMVEQYEARLQFAPEFVDPTARLRRLRPDTLVYSYEWFVDDPRIVDAVERHAMHPVTLPHGWTLADVSEPTERSEESPPSTTPDIDGHT